MASHLLHTHVPSFNYVLQPIPGPSMHILIYIVMDHRVRELDQGRLGKAQNDSGVPVSSHLRINYGMPIIR